MARVHNALQCDCCGELYRDESKGGVVISFDGPYLSTSRDKLQLDDICEDCRKCLWNAIDNALPQFAKDKRDFREVKPEPLPPTAPHNKEPF